MYKLKWVVPEKIRTHPTNGILEILVEGGVKDPGNPGRRGVKLEKVFCRGHFDRQFSDSSALSDPENSRNILFSYFSPNMNDNLSSFTGPFVAENMNNKILKNVPSQCYCNKAFETPDIFLLVPRPRACNFT